MFWFRPSLYKKNIFDIDYNLLKREKIKCIVFDLDNTLGLIDEIHCPKKTIKLINDLKKDFIICICSNNNKKRIIPYMNELGIDGVSWSMKPWIRGLKIIKKKYSLNKNEIVMIGDQMITDILSGNIFAVKTILVDPLGKKDLKITGINRILENIIVKRYGKKGVFERGNYYG